MSIQTRLEDERGIVVATLDAPAWLTDWVVSCADTGHTVCLRFIDPYGDTVFNRHQMKVLAEELVALGAGLTEDRIQQAYNEWLARFDRMDAKIRESARRYPKPSRTLLLNHIGALQSLIQKGVERSHLYLRFIGD